MLTLIQYRVAAIAAFALAASGPALAQERSVQASITVIGRGHTETPPDRFTVSAEIEGRGASQVLALRALADAQSKVSDVAKLEGLEKVSFTTGSPALRPTFSPSCGGSGYDRDTDDCPIVGYVASMSLTLEASPIARAGDALSLISERGARNASVQAFTLADVSQQEILAQRAAFEDARRQAQALATASDQRIVRLVRIQDPSAEQYPSAELRAMHRVDEVVVTGARVRPTVSLDVAPPPVRTEARVLATFEIE
jgi:uncharacterized protein